MLGSFVSSLALRVVGSAALTAEDLSPALADMKVCVCVCLEQLLKEQGCSRERNRKKHISVFVCVKSWIGCTVLNTQAFP